VKRCLTILALTLIMVARSSPRQSSSPHPPTLAAADADHYPALDSQKLALAVQTSHSYM
jgi:hypothetical protein